MKTKNKDGSITFDPPLKFGDTLPNDTTIQHFIDMWEGNLLEHRKQESAYIFPHSYVQRLIGKLMETIEIMGLPTSQEISIKKAIRNHVYDIWNDSYAIEGAVWDELKKTNFPMGNHLFID